MADLSIQLGDIFLINTPNKPHYFVAIAQTSNNKFLFVSVIAKKPKSESACVLQPGIETPSFIVKESTIDYRYAREMNIKQLFAVLATDSFKYCCSSKILEQIRQGGLKSKRLKNKYKNILKQY